MASMATHLSAFLLLFPIGLRRLHSSSSLYLHSPSHFRSKTWYLSEPTWKNLDLYALLILLPIASFSDLILFLSFPSSSSHPTYKFSFFLQSSTLVAFWILLIFIALHQFPPTSSFISENLVFLFGGVVFLMEYCIMEKGVTGLAGVVYGLMSGLTLVCSGSCIYLSIKQNAFFADFLLSSGMVFKATWFLQSGFLLYTDGFGVKGCEKISSFLLFNQQEKGVTDAVDVNCSLEEDRLRGFALVNLLFTVHALVVMVLAVGLFLVLAGNKGFRFADAKGPLLSEIESTSSRIRALPELEMD